MTLKSEWAASVIDNWTASNSSTDDSASRLATADETVVHNDSVLPDEELYYDTLFEILSNQRRRGVVQYLFETQSTVSLGCIAEHLAAIENDTTVRNITSQERKRTYIALYQCHLPKMADAGLIEYDSDRGTLAPGPHLEIAQAYLTDSSGTSEIPPLAYTAPPVAVGISAFLLFSSALMGLAFVGITLFFIFMVVITTICLGHTEV